MLPRKDQYAKMPAPMPNMLVNPYISPTKPNDQQNYRYFNECNKLYYTAYCIKTQMNQFAKIKNQIYEKLGNIEKSLEDVYRITINNEQRTQSNKPRRFRRTNNQIDKPYKCNYDKCDKIYASEGSLQQHIKLKHQKTTYTGTSRLQLKCENMYGKIQQSQISNKQQMEQEDEQQDQAQEQQEISKQQENKNKKQESQSESQDK